jgi:hypothetical protein
MPLLQDIPGDLCELMAFGLSSIGGSVAYPIYPSNVVFSIPNGIATVVPQTTPFALPARPHRLQSTVVLETSIDGTTYTAVTATTTGIDSQAVLARCTTSTATVIVKSY